MENLRLHTFKCDNYKSIKHIELKHDTLDNKIIQVRGEIGSSKSSLFEGLNIALSGKDGIQNTTHLEEGFASEVCLMDGDKPIFLGAKIHTTKLGEKSFKTFVYSKDENGKKVDVMFNGEKATAKKLHEALTTDITFNMADLFSPNQTIHKKLITKLFSSELEKIGVDEYLERIKKAKALKDKTRAICEANGSFMSTFKEEGFEKDELGGMSIIDIDSLNRQLIDVEIEKDRAIHEAENSAELEKQKFENNKQAKLSAIKDKASMVIEKIRELNKEREDLNTQKENERKEFLSLKERIDQEYRNITQAVTNCSIISKEDSDKINDIIKAGYQKRTKGCTPKDVEKLVIIPIDNGKPIIPEIVPNEYQSLLSLRSGYLSEYAKVNAEQPPVIETKVVDTSVFDNKKTQIESRLAGANRNNRIVERFGQWEEWTEAKGLHEKELNKLAKLYADIDTGVSGLKIVPFIKEGSGKVDLWLMYDGSYDTDFFNNKTGELRHISEQMGYSESQCGIIGLMLQASRLDAKKQTLRLAILDSVPLHTKGGMKMLERVQKEFDLQIVISRTDDTYDIDDLEDGHIVMENGEVFFK